MRRLSLDAANESYGLWNREGAEAVAERFWSDDIVGVEDPSVPDAGEYHGRAEMVRWMGRMIEVFGHFQMEPEEVVEHGGLYLVTLRLEGAGPRGGVPVARRVHHVLELDGDGMVCRFRNFLTREGALAALGVED